MTHAAKRVSTAVLAASLLVLSGAAVTGRATASSRARATSAHFQEFWQGTWDIGGGRTMKLKQDGRDVSGTFRGGSNHKEGTISGETTQSGRTWTGHYKDTTTGDRGTFKAVLESDDVSFSGTFKSKYHDTIYDWSGTKA